MSAPTRIGLEVHVPLRTRAKLFCPCPADPPEEPNTSLCPTCTGQPGARPQGVNARAIELACLAGRVLGCQPSPETVVQRKHYVYPDLPNNYQRTSTPFGEEGSFWGVGIREVHMEEDPGAYDPGAGRVDLNRSGTPLVEIVTEPDLPDADAVDEWIGVLRLALERAGVVRETGELKADVNVSTAGGDRVEVKNVVGGRNAARAARYEIDRQTRLREEGDPVARETRHFDEDKGITTPSRTKETVGDYRYMPDPDLRPLDLVPAREGLAEPPDVPAKLRALREDIDLELGEAVAILADRSLETLFDRLRQEVPLERAVDLTLTRLRGELEYRDTTLTALDRNLDVLVDLARAWEREEITRHVLTRLLRAHLDGEEDVPERLAAERDAGVDLDAIARDVVDENPEAVEDYQDGKDEAVNYLVGQVMAETNGRADPKQTREALVEVLETVD